jgi:hypothetical protein
MLRYTGVAVEKLDAFFPSTASIHYSDSELIQKIKFFFLDNLVVLLERAIGPSLGFCLYRTTERRKMAETAFIHAVNGILTTSLGPRPCTH